MYPIGQTKKVCPVGHFYAFSDPTGCICDRFFVCFDGRGGVLSLGRASHNFTYYYDNYYIF